MPVLTCPVGNSSGKLLLNLAKYNWKVRTCEASKIVTDYPNQARLLCIM